MNFPQQGSPLISALFSDGRLCVAETVASRKRSGFAQMETLVVLALVALACIGIFGLAGQTLKRAASRAIATLSGEQGEASGDGQGTGGLQDFNDTGPGLGGTSSQPTGEPTPTPGSDTAPRLVLVPAGSVQLADGTTIPVYAASNGPADLNGRTVVGADGKVSYIFYNIAQTDIKEAILAHEVDHARTGSDPSLSAEDKEASASIAGARKAKELMAALEKDGKHDTDLYRRYDAYYQEQLTKYKLCSSILQWFCPL